MIIEAKDNPKIKTLRKLKQKKYRKLEQKYLVFNDNIILEANKNDQLIQVITTDLNYCEGDVIHITEDVMSSLCDFTPTPVKVGLVKIPEEREYDQGNVLVLDEIQDPGNMGTILRTARAFGFKNIFIGNGCVDVYNEKVVSASQGVLSSLNFKFGDVFEYLKDDDKIIVTTFLNESIDQIDKDIPFNLVLGNEGRGINKGLKKLDHKNYKLDIEFESLNVAVAAGIILYNLK